MGGCCCCSSKRAELDGVPIYYYCPPNLEENEPLSAIRGTSSAVSAGMFVDTNLDTSSPDTYRAPPAPLPYGADLAGSQTLPRKYENCAEKNDQTKLSDFQQAGETDRFEGSSTCGDLETECKKKDGIEDDCMRAQKDEISKLDGPITSGMDEEDVCPICLEEYDLENPRIITKCEHHFHLSCILEWMERSEVCPVCDQIMMVDRGLIE